MCQSIKKQTVRYPQKRVDAIGAFMSLALIQLSAKITLGPSKAGALNGALPSARVYSLPKNFMVVKVRIELTTSGL